ncbi:MAG: DsrE family protein [Aquificota bacterium]|nr:DsrE family protein [Aquificota bacterium]
MKVLFVITSIPYAKDYNTVLNLVKKLREKDHEVVVFFSGNGVYYLIRPEARELSELGARVLFCSHSAHQRGVPTDVGWAESSSTYGLSQIIGEYDRVLVFN